MGFVTKTKPVKNKQTLSLNSDPGLTMMHLVWPKKEQVYKNSIQHMNKLTI